MRLYLSSFRMGDHPEHLLDLALLTEAFVPHYRSPGHPETAAIERVVARYRADGTPYRALHDGQALLINGPQTMIV